MLKKINITTVVSLVMIVILAVIAYQNSEAARQAGKQTDELILTIQQKDTLITKLTAAVKTAQDEAANLKAELAAAKALNEVAAPKTAEAAPVVQKPAAQEPVVEQPVAAQQPVAAEQPAADTTQAAAK
jgi:hypothetical protein